MKQTLLYFLRFLLALLFLYTTYVKIIDFDQFELVLFKSEIISNNFRSFLIYFVPVFEFMIFILLLIDITYKIGLYISLFTLSVFTIYLIALNNFSLFDGCSCGGVFYTLEYKEHLLINFFFIFINLIGLVLSKMSAKISLKNK